MRIVLRIIIPIMVSFVTYFVFDKYVRPLGHVDGTSVGYEEGIITALGIGAISYCYVHLLTLKKEEMRDDALGFDNYFDCTGGSGGAF